MDLAWKPEEQTECLGTLFSIVYMEKFLNQLVQKHMTFRNDLCEICYLAKVSFTNLLKSKFISCSKINITTTEHTYLLLEKESHVAQAGLTHTYIAKDNPETAGMCQNTSLRGERMEFRTSYVLGKCSARWATFP